MRYTAMPSATPVETSRAHCVEMRLAKRNTSTAQSRTAHSRRQLTAAAARSAALFAVLGAALAGAPATASAQEPLRALRLGQPVAATLTADDPRYGTRGHFHAYRLDAKAGQRFEVSMSSDDVDSYVWVARSVSGLTEEIGADDDGGGDTNARLRFRATAAGTYFVVAQSLEAAAVGAYELRVVELPPAPQPTLVVLQVGQPREGVLDESSPVLDEGPGELRYALYGFSARGQRVRVTVRSGAFDAMLRVTKVTPAGEEEVGTDDDSGGGTDAQLVLTANGEYRVYARPLESEKSGPFTVSVSEVIVQPVTSRPLPLGQTTEASLVANDPTLDDGRQFHQYTLSGRPGERFVVTMRSRAFDAFLDWGSLTDNVFESSSTDDDSAGETDARLEITLPADGTFVLRVMGLERGKLGAYSLQVERRVAK